jgi:hypothetical protein
MLFTDTWVIVSQDQAVVLKAAEYNIETITPTELAAIIDKSTR